MDTLSEVEIIKYESTIRLLEGMVRMAFSEGRFSKYAEYQWDDSEAKLALIKISEDPHFKLPKYKVVTEQFENNGEQK
jgi:hypothetical protein